MSLERLALSRATLDRAAHLRIDPDLLRRVVGDVSTRVLLLDGDRAPIAHTADGPRLQLVSPEQAGPALADPAATIFLGVDAAGHSHVAVRDVGRSGGAGSVATDAVTDWAGLREVGAHLGDTDAGIMTTAVALTNWHATHPRCARCGEPTEMIQAGWVRRCPNCGAEHYPRTDPAVIMSVVDPDDRLMLGHQAVWPAGRFSTLAGFVEPGESLEAAVRREVYEESGVEVGEVTYLGNQPWPFPSSLMLGFRAEARTTELRPDGQELAVVRWFTRADLARAVTDGDVVLPPSVSIARRLIEHWYGSPIAGREAWR